MPPTRIGHRPSTNQAMFKQHQEMSAKPRFMSKQNSVALALTLGGKALERQRGPGMGCSVVTVANRGCCVGSMQRSQISPCPVWRLHNLLRVGEVAKERKAPQTGGKGQEKKNLP